MKTHREAAIDRQMYRRSELSRLALTVALDTPNMMFWETSRIAAALGVNKYISNQIKKALVEIDAAGPASAPAPAPASVLKVQELTAKRGKVYGHPSDNFRRISIGQEVISECKDREVAVALGMIWVKVCRLVETPDHADSIDDIAGYADTIRMLHARRREIPGG